MKLENALIISLFLFSSLCLRAQDSFFPGDDTTLLKKLHLYDTIPLSLLTAKDSLRLYKSIYNFAGQRKVTMLVYKLVFNERNLYPVKVSTYNPVTPGGPADNFDRYAGKIIRNINIISLDPFGVSVQDTVLTRDNILKTAGNRLHVRSNKITIRNRLLFKRGKALDPFLLRESERLLRSANFIRDAKILIEPIPGNPDSTDVLVLSQDRWAIIASATVSGGSTKFSLTEKNFLGWGHYFRNNMVVNYLDPLNPKVDGTYSTSYIRNSFVSFTGTYNNSLQNNFIGLSLDRPFYSSIAKWAGGIGYIKYGSTVSYATANENIFNFPLVYDKKDFWAGRSYQLVKGRSVAKRTTRLILSASYEDLHYLRRPGFEFDSLRNFQHLKQYLGAIGLTNQQYYKDRFIFRFGEGEDVPTGRLFEIISGIEQKEFSHRYYFAAKAAAGNHVNNFGNFAVSGEYGTFFKQNKREDGVLNFGFDYFTDRWKYGKWSGRQFVYGRFTRGYDRPSTDRLNINDNNGLYGFKSATLSGDRKMFLNLISVVYTPLKFLGFRFGAMVFGSFGTVANSREDLLKTRLYQGYGIGLLIRNDQLVVKSFEISIGIYPFIPENSNPAFRFDVISPSDIRFRDYGMTRPTMISFQ